MCGEDFSHSAYYRHKRFCSAMKHDDNDQENLELDLPQNISREDCDHNSSSSSFSLGNNEDCEGIDLDLHQHYAQEGGV